MKNSSAKTKKVTANTLSGWGNYNPLSNSLPRGERTYTPSPLGRGLGERETI